MQLVFLPDCEDDMATDLTKGRPLSVLFRFSLPVIGGNLFQLFYTLADTLIVGQTIGEDALAAVGATSVFVYFILCFITGMTGGFSIILAHDIGSRREEDARRNIVASIYISVAVTVVITAVTCIFAKGIISMMGIPEAISNDAYIYMLIVLAGTGATVLYNLISNILRALGDSRLPLIYLIISSLLNVVLDIVFIVPFGMGVGGAALATVLSQLLSGVLSLISAKKRYSVMSIGRKYWHPDVQALRRNLSLGFIMGFQMSVMCIGQVVMQSSVNRFGTAAIAGYTAATKMDQLSVLINGSYVSTVSAYVSQNQGAGETEKIRNGVRSSLLLSLITDAVIMCIIMIVEPYVVPLFVANPSPDTFLYCRDFFIITVPFYPLLGILCVYRTAVQSLGNSKAPFAACIAELAARCSASILLAIYAGYRGVVFSTPFAWLLADMIVVTAYFMMMHRTRDNA